MRCAECLDDMDDLLESENWYTLLFEATEEALTIADGKALCRKHLLARREKFPL